MDWNKIQTSLEDLQVSKEVYDELLYFLDSVQFLQVLINSERKYARDLEKDELGRIKVNITDPHILENMDYFRQAAIHFQKHKKYTSLFPNSSQSSSYYKFWREETRRCREGMIRPEDGEWIPGPYYFYLNYSPLLKSVVVKGTKRAEKHRDFPDVYDGDYLYFHYVWQAKENGAHAGLLKRRGCGFSSKAGSGLTRILVVGDSSINSGAVTGFAIASEKEFLIKDGILTKFDTNVHWCASSTPWPRLKSRDSMNSMVWEMGYTDSQGLTQGTRNSVIGVTTQGDPDKARGKRGAVIYWDEWGKFPNLIKSWNVATESVQEGDFAFGTMIGGGTGGTEGADFVGAEEMFYNPSGYNIYALPNVFDRNTNGRTKCALFFPAYLNRLGCYDENGNSDVIKALVEILVKRMQIKYNSTDANTIVQHKAEMPITPQEAIMRREGSIFPVSDLKDYLADILPDVNKFIGAHYIGHLKYNTDGYVVWDKRDLHPVLRNYPLKDELDRIGNIELFEMPQRLADGSIPFWRYIAGIDPIDSDAGLYTNSLGSIFVYDTWRDRIVAEYSGRPPLASEFYENCIRVLKFYNAIANYENNLKGLFQYFEAHKALHHLCDTPSVLRDMDFAKGTLIGNRSKGTTANKAVNAWGRKLQADWMIGEAYNPDAEDEESPIKILNLQKIRSLGYLKELVSWNPDDNFDRISAMGMLMILKADREKFEQRKYSEKISTVLDDPWFKRFGYAGSKQKVRNPAKTLRPTS